MEDLKPVNPMSWIETSAECASEWTCSGQMKGQHVVDEERKSNKRRGSLFCLICAN